MRQRWRSQWVPKGGITRHTGSPIPPEMDFFVVPPPDIGKILSADSTLTTLQQPLPLGIRLLIALAVGLVMAVATFFAIAPLQLDLMLPLILGIGGLVGLLAYFSIQFSHRCSFVGDSGIVEYRIRGSRSSTPRKRLLYFSNAKELYTSQVRNYSRQTYTDTSYDYTWICNTGKPFRLRGRFKSYEGWPKEGDAWHFANAAEFAWSAYLLQFANQQLEQVGYVEFPLKSNPKAVRVGDGYIAFQLKDGSTQQASVQDMKDISLDGGRFQFTHKDARWWSGKGKYAFTYSTIPNARLFLLCLDRLARISWD